MNGHSEFLLGIFCFLISLILIVDIALSLPIYDTPIQKQNTNKCH
jgi:hypothetical protein